MVDFTALNRSVIRPVHSFPSSDQIANQIKPETRHFATLDFLNGYFQLGLQKDSQLLTTFIVKCRRYFFLQAPQGLASSGDEFNVTTDCFFQGLYTYLLKQVDDLLIQAESMEDMEKYLKKPCLMLRKTGLHFFL